MAVLFDTLKLAERLEAAGMPPRQARDVANALAETITGDLVTREHFDTCRTADREYLEASRRADREYLDLRLGEMEARIKGEVRGWLTTQAFAIVAAVAAIVGVAAALAKLIH